MRSIIVAVCVFWAGTVAAQKENISFGPMIGGTYANLANIPSQYETSFKVGFSAGAFVNYSIKEHFGLTANVLYSRIGGEINRANGGSVSIPKLNLDYIHVPILATYYFGNDMGSGAIRPKLFVGPSVSFLVNNNADPVLARNVLNTNTFKTLDIGATIGAGVNIGLPRQHWLNIDVRYNRGFSKIDDSPANKVPDLSNMRNHSFGINVGYSIPVGRYDKSSNSFSGKRR